ncbi:chromosome segregation SMC family protein [Candidatus Nitrosocosmicus franklandus]|uniref:Chromosome partition protein Smc n=1 Tax=Candidatus Nitrosocosmicus franklandianus TaxID=1798806 RepID=A0A484ID24_9ARCH|nr:chromosome segregation SMC family protein [Candidatus Nitrosocosmicus franklandus]VFJ14119.1 Chromosome partition protein Smc [Candidatus Nitrosocosmicus franklandus]
MVYIKRLDVFGFKSFGSKNISLNFQKGLIAVTGPNGSGKSNILDAIIFALGENSPKALRVDKFQSLFHDSDSINNHNKVVKVSVTFDNEDRGIPIDDDLVTITREMSGGTTGESQYYLNKKKVSRNNILELMEIVVASPNKLNIVQQGMITRISELNAEERRKIIEDIIGLSYFDEKKEQAYKQLEESDRRLEIALAKMGEVRNRIDELEEERNYQHRYSQIESEINRLKAIRLSRSLNKIEKKITELKEEKKNKEEKSIEVSKKLDEINSQIENINKDKEQFLMQANSSTNEKINHEKKLSAVNFEYQKIRSAIKEAEYHLNQLIENEKTNKIEQETHQKRITELKIQLKNIEPKIHLLEKEKSKLRNLLETKNKQFDEIKRKNLDEINHKNFLTGRINKLIPIKGKIEINIARLEENIKNYSTKVKENDTQIHQLLVRNKEIEEVVSISRSKINDMDKELNALRNEKERIEEKLLNMKRETNTSKQVLENAEKIIIKYDEKIKLAKNSLIEDYAIATLSKDFENLGVIGYVFNLLTWNEKYQKAVIASGNEWMKAIIVKDIKSMITLAEFSKTKGINFLKIIPQELLIVEKIKSVEDNPSVLGVLSDFVSSKIPHLSEFLFGNIVLTKNPLTAYLLAKKGFKAVSTTGEIFFPDLSLMQFDYGSKIADITKDLLLSDSVDHLKRNMERLRELTKLRVLELDELNELNISKTRELDGYELERSNIIKKIEEAKNTMTTNHKNLNHLYAINKEHSLFLDKLFLNLKYFKKRLDIILNTNNRINLLIEKIEERIDHKRIEKIEEEKNAITVEIESLNNKLNQLKLTESMTANNLESISRLYNRAKEVYENIEREKIEKKKILENAVHEGERIELEMKVLREKEDEIIQSSSLIYTKLQEYENINKTLSEQEKKTGKELNQLDKDLGFLKKDIADLENQFANKSNELARLGHKVISESFDVEMLYHELEEEYESIKDKVNFRADETYLEIIEGYRGLSDKRNQLEEERNSIISFIEEIAKEKENQFIDAFRKVDEDIRKTFSDITGGNAWLELENPDNIFSGGILLMVQFPNKPARESTSLSGGEKTMAAIVFLLALQSLKPSPFYLMDEVDAHLDAQNTDRLSKILLLRSVNNQIIMVTLKDSTVAKSDLIFGVYPKNGISQVVKYNHPSKVKVEAQ